MSVRLGLGQVRRCPCPFGLSLSKSRRADSDGMLVLRAEAGSRPAASDFLLLRQKKVTKEKATPSLRPLRDAKGQTCGGAVAGRAVELTARCALRSDNHGELDNEACAHSRACSPRNRPDAGAASRGGTAEQPHGPLLRSASRSRREAP